MKKIGLFLLILLSISAAPALADEQHSLFDGQASRWNNQPGLTGVTDSELEAALATKTEKLCGWYSNPAPGNNSLYNKDGEWTIDIQGTYTALGERPSFEGSKEYVMTNGSYGHGCACINSNVLKEGMMVASIQKAEVMPLSFCRNNKTLTEPQ